MQNSVNGEYEMFERSPYERVVYLSFQRLIYKNNSNCKYFDNTNKFIYINKYPLCGENYLKDIVKG